MQPQPDWPHTLEEFRAWHARQPEVWEFLDGTPRLMAPGSKAHTLIKSNVGALGNGLRAPIAASWSMARWWRCRARR